MRKETTRLRLFGAILIYLVGWGLRVTVMGAHRLHPDEALYGYWGFLILSGRDPWLATVPVYKPPLLPYTTAGSLALLGRSELAVRLPGLMAGLATVGLTDRLAWRLYRDRLTGLVAMATVALSPFTVLFSATGFTDPLMVAWGLAACVVAAEGQTGWAGLLAGLAFATKQTGIAWLPLVGWLLLVQTARHRLAVRELAYSAAGFLAVIGLVVLWDQGRIAQGATGFWTAGVTGYGGLRLIWPAEEALRVRAWTDWLHHILGSRLLEVGLLAGAVALVVRGVRWQDWPALVDLVLIGFCLAYLMVHWLWAFPVWDRYLLPLVPLVGILLGRVTSLLGHTGRKEREEHRRTRRNFALFATLAVFIGALGLAAGQAVAGGVPVGAGLPAYDGIEKVTDFLRDLPEGTVLYHHWLGWEYAFYLFDGPLYLAYWPTPAWLAQDVLAFGETGPRYVVFPAWEPSARVEAALAEVGYYLVPVFRARDADGTLRFIVYRIRHHPSPASNALPPATYGPRSYSSAALLLPTLP